MPVNDALPSFEKWKGRSGRAGTRAGGHNDTQSHAGMAIGVHLSHISSLILYSRVYKQKQDAWPRYSSLY